jgi:hypothetical protein
MNEFKELLIEYLRRKDEILYKLTQIHLMDYWDYHEILGWSDQSYINAFERMRQYLHLPRGFISRCDSMICPWCSLVESYCPNCGYGDRHGVCDFDNEDATYVRIRNQLDGRPFHMSPEIDRLVRITVYRYYALLTIEVKE